MTFIGLQEGKSGTAVEYLQSTLNKLGYNAGKVDGIFGSKTRTALKRFQSANNLAVDGIIGKETWNALLPFLQGYFIYKIKKNDTFYKIAEKFSSSITNLRTANPLLDEKNLQIGEEIVVPILSQTVPTDVSYTYEIMEFNLRSIKKRYPFVEIFSIGKSALGRNLYAIKLGCGATEVFYNASHHANEWITSVVMMKFAEQFAAAYSKKGLLGGEDVSEIFENTSIYIVPMVNPDGVDLVTGNIEKSSDSYKNALKLNGNEENFPKNWKANILGTDLNLNYPAGWEEAKKYKFSLGYTSPRPFGFVGPYPLSEPETKAISRFTERHDFRLSLSYHSQGRLIFWKYKDYRPKNDYTNGLYFAEYSGYTLSETPPEMGNAGYKDWFIEKFRYPGYTIEVGEGKNPLPISDFPEIYKDNLGILLSAALLAE